MPFRLEPLDSETHVLEDKVGKGHAGKHTLRFSEQHRVVRRIPDDEAADIPLGDVLLNPVDDLLLPGGRQQGRPVVC